MSILFALQTIPIVLLAVYLVTRRSLFRNLTIAAVVFTQCIFPLLGGMIVRSVAGKHFEESGWTAPYAQGVGDAIAITNGLTVLSWISLLCVIILVFFKEHRNQRGDVGF